MHPQLYINCAKKYSGNERSSKFICETLSEERIIMSTIQCKEINVHIYVCYCYTEAETSSQS